MKILFHDELGNEQDIFVCGGCNEAWTKPFCDVCNACDSCCACVDWEGFWMQQEMKADAKREDLR